MPLSPHQQLPASLPALASHLAPPSISVLACPLQSCTDASVARWWLGLVPSLWLTPLKWGHQHPAGRRERQAGNCSGAGCEVLFAPARLTAAFPSQGWTLRSPAVRELKLHPGWKQHFLPAQEHGGAAHPQVPESIWKHLTLEQDS